MTLSKTIKQIVGIAVIFIGVWYFMIKDYDYKITFTTSQAPGIVYDRLTKWTDGETFEQIPFSEIHHKVVAGDSIFTFRWTFIRKNDSTTLVTAKIRDEKHSLKQKLQVPFYENGFVKSAISRVKKLGESLIENAENYKISKVSREKIPAQNCAYISLESEKQNKASTMVKNISIVMNYIKDNNIELVGDPFLEVTEWNLLEDTIKFDFCFPIEERDTYPEVNTVKFKKTKERDALKAIFNGNYKISDRAWYDILDHAEMNDVIIEKLPVEVFLNDPHSGGDSLEWEAEIYMPLLNKAIRN